MISSLKQIITDYNNNEVRADNLYQDRTFIISGYVTIPKYPDTRESLSTCKAYLF